MQKDEAIILEETKSRGLFQLGVFWIHFGDALARLSVAPGVRHIEDRPICESSVEKTKHCIYFCGMRATQVLVAHL
jgi:hypothetical protein